MDRRNRTTSRSRTIDAPHLSASDIRRLPKPRSGWVQFAQEVIAILNSRTDAITVKGLDLDAMTASLAAYAAASEDVAEKKAAYVAAADAHLVLASNCWGDTLVGYGHIKIAARTDGRLQTALEPLEAFMRKRGSRKKAKDPTTTSVSKAPANPVAA